MEATSDEPDEPDIEDSESSSELWARRRLRLAMLLRLGAWEKRAEHLARYVDGRTKSSRQSLLHLEYRVHVSRNFESI